MLAHWLHDCRDPWLMARPRFRAVFSRAFLALGLVFVVLGIAGVIR
jgi:hypothetical protein